MGSLRQEDQQFKVSLGYTRLSYMRVCLKNKTKTKSMPVKPAHSNGKKSRAEMASVSAYESVCDTALHQSSLCMDMDALLEARLTEIVIL